MPKIFIFNSADRITRIVTDIPDLECVSLCADEDKPSPDRAVQLPLSNVRAPEDSSVHAFYTEQVQYDPYRAARIAAAIAVADANSSTRRGRCPPE